MLKLSFLFILSLGAMAALGPLQIENLNLNFQNQKAQGHVDRATYQIGEVKIGHRDLKLAINTKNQQLNISTPDTSVSISGALDFLGPFNALTVDSTNLSLTENNLTIKSPLLAAHIGTKGYEATGLELEGGIDPSFTTNELINSFVEDGRLKVSSISYEPETKEEFIQDLQGENFNFAGINVKKIVDLAYLRNLNLSFKKRYFHGSLSLDSWIFKTLRLRGEVLEQEDPNVIKIRLDKVKAGIVGVKRFVLKAIRKMNSPAINVSGDYITISLK